jgi:N-methylhydantoinase B
VVELNAIELGVFSSRLGAVCDEMAAVLQRSAFSPNIKDRLDFSCAVFDAGGQLAAQAAHIPVHLGSMAYAMEDIIDRCQWAPGDMVVVNDPYLGGTHLPDVTVIAPIFVAERLTAFVVNRAHHANIGASSPGSMPLSTSLSEEGVIIAPTHLLKQGQLQTAVMDSLAGDIDEGDFIAQISANKVGLLRLSELVAVMGVENYTVAVSQLNDYGERLALSALGGIPEGQYSFTDYMDDDGAGTERIPVTVTLTIGGDAITADFSGTASQVEGNINCPLSVAAAAVFYAFRCLMPESAPACAGLFRPVHLHAPVGSLVNALRPAAVAAGNVETSTRITDVVLGALALALPERIPAASHGSMNNVAMGSAGDDGISAWDYYETIGGGMGASAAGPGLSAVQTHMTNTLNTPVESLEMHYPLRILRYQLRRGSCGQGLYQGGEGLLREFQFLADTSVTLLTERRSLAPWGLGGGGDAQPGENRVNGALVAAKCQYQLKAGDCLSIATAGGGGWGRRQRKA